MRLSSFVAATAVISASIAARADILDFTFGASSSSFSGSGVLTTGGLLAPGEYSITGVTGTVQTLPNGPNLVIHSILAPDTFPTISNGDTFPANDNVLFVNNGVGSFSEDGLSFVLSNGAQINLFNDGSGIDALLERTSGIDVFEDAPITITSVAATPEPSSLALLGTALLGFVGMTRRRSM